MCVCGSAYLCSKSPSRQQQQVALPIDSASPSWVIRPAQLRPAARGDQWILSSRHTRTGQVVLTLTAPHILAQQPCLKIEHYNDLAASDTEMCSILYQTLCSFGSFTNAVKATVENAQTNNKPELFRSKFCERTEYFLSLSRKKTELEKRVSL